MFKQNVKIIVEGTDTFWGRTFDLTIQLLILYSLICLTIETLPDLSPQSEKFLAVNELVVIIVFTLGGKIFTFGVLLLGLGAVAIPTGLVATALTRARQEEYAQAQKLADLEALKQDD